MKITHLTVTAVVKPPPPDLLEVGYDSRVIKYGTQITSPHLHLGLGHCPALVPPA